MEDPIGSFVSPKYAKVDVQSRSSNGRKSGKGGQIQPFTFQNEQRGQVKEPAFVRKVREYIAEDAKQQISFAQDFPLTTEKAQNLTKPTVKVQKNSQAFRLHTEERAARRAGFNHLVASKISSFEILQRFEVKIKKVIEEEEIKIMRKEMVPKAQLMPIFDRPFLPQRSTRAPTVPIEPKFCLVNRYCGAGKDSHSVHSYFIPNSKAIR